MTRRIALAILATVWTTLILGGGVAYLVTRAVLLDDLDEQIIAYARSWSGAEDRPEYRKLESQPPDALITADVLNNAGDPIDRTVDRDNWKTPGKKPAVLQHELMQRASGQRYRHLRLEFSPRFAGDLPMRVDYYLPSDHFDLFLNRLLMALSIFGAIAGVASALVAIKVSREALRPLHETARTIGEIDERRIDRRIDSLALPPELWPVADRLNQMLERLELAFGQRKQFLADASHELRTPVAALVTTIEVALRRPRDAADGQRC